MADSGPGAAPCDVFPGVRKQERLADTIGPDAAAAPGPLYVGGAFGPTWPRLPHADAGPLCVGRALSWAARRGSMSGYASTLRIRYVVRARGHPARRGH